MSSICRQIKLPFIDFNNGADELTPDCPNWAACRAQVKRALEVFGCFEAHFDGVPMDLQKKMIGSLQEMFDLPLDVKLLNISKKAYRGYLGQFPGNPLYESMAFEDADVLENVEESISSLWPQGHPTLSKTAWSYTEKLLKLDQIIRRMILESLGLEKYLEEHLSSSYYLLCFNKYKEPQTTEKKFALNAHTDNGLLSILCKDKVDGLEVETEDGEWTNVKPSPESFIVIVGDLLYAPDELVDEDHPLLFKPFDNDEFMEVLKQRGGGAGRICPQDFM